MQKTSHENKTIVEKNAKILICILLTKDCTIILKKLEIIHRFPKIFENGLFKLLVSKTDLNKLANYFDISIENLKFLILLIAVESDYQNFFELLFKQENYVQTLQKETINDIFKVAIIRENISLIKFFTDKGYEIPATQDFAKTKFEEQMVKLFSPLEASLNKADPEELINTFINVNKSNSSPLEALINLNRKKLVPSSFIFDMGKLVINLFYYIHSQSKLDFTCAFHALRGIAKDPKTKSSQELLSKFNLHDVDDETGTSFLIAAAGFGEEELVRFLLENSVEINLQNNAGATPISAAVYYANSPSIVKLLLDHGADYNIPDANGITALGWALRFGNQEIISMLQEAEKKKNQRSKCNLY